MEIYQEGDFVSKGGKAFKTEKACAMALGKAKVRDQYSIVETQGGWVGRPDPVEGGNGNGTKQDDEQKPKVESYRFKGDLGPVRKVRVHRNNVDPDNKDQSISVCVNALVNKRTFFPGQVVELTKAHLDVLKNSVEYKELPLPEGSHVYDARDPLQAAQNQYPNMEVRRSPISGRIVAIRTSPNYTIEYLDEDE